MHKNFSSLRLVISYMTIKIINTCNKKISLLCTTIVHGHDYLWDKVLSVWKRRHTCLLSSIVKIVKIHFASSSTVQASLLAYIELKITKQKIIYLLPIDWKFSIIYSLWWNLPWNELVATRWKISSISIICIIYNY